MQCLKILFLSFLCIITLALCDLYAGMLQNRDILLVAQDRIFKERIPYRVQYAKYGRVFKCPITYLRVVDRLGYGNGPKTKIIRGGLRRKYVSLRLSAYNSPISVNIYVACDSKLKYTTRTTKTSTTKLSAQPTTTAVEAEIRGHWIPQTILTAMLESTTHTITTNPTTTKVRNKQRLKHFQSQTEEIPEMTTTAEEVPEMTPETAPETTTENTPETTPEAKQEATSATTQEATTEATPETTTEATPETTPETPSTTTKRKARSTISDAHDNFKE